MPQTDLMVEVTGIGSWPGTDVRSALGVVRDLLTSTPEGVTGVPYLPELPARGAGADMVGRTADLLVDLPVDLQPQGWRLVDHRGRDAERAASFWRQDLDELAEAFDGWQGPLKVQVTGPWTLASSLWLPLGDRVLSDAGAVRDLGASLAEGLAEHVRTVARLVPGAQVIAQVDEPSLPAVLAGAIPNDSGYLRLRAPDPQDARQAIAEVLAAARDAGATTTVVHCCADRPPWALLRAAGPDVLAVDVLGPQVGAAPGNGSQTADRSPAGGQGNGGRTADGGGLGPRQWESLATGIEEGVRLWAGALPSVVGKGEQLADHGAVAADLARRWQQVGLPLASLADLGVSPTCGLAGAAPDQARAITASSVAVAAALAELAAG